MKLFVRGLLAGACLMAGFILTGCGSSAEDQSFQNQGVSNAAPTPEDPNAARFRVGDTVGVDFSYPGGATPPLPSHGETIKEDGNITLDLIPPIHALGKTSGELQYEIYTNYVPKYFKQLTVTVTSGSRVIYIGGEVRSPGRVEYLGDTTITRTIHAAGGLTDFASHSRIWITRAATGERIKVDYDDALTDSSKDLPVYPDDQILVERRVW
jgi:protein involved in polysaccharide export with SLBB domain